MRYLVWIPRTVFATEEKPGDRGATTVYRGNDLVLVCLSDLTKEATRLPEERISRWATREPFHLNWSEDYERQVVDEIAAQRAAAMAEGSDLVVIAHPSDDHWMDPQKWIVERTLLGQSPRSIQVRVVLPWTVTPRAFLFLRRVGDLYEPVRIGGGVVPIEEDRVPRWGISLKMAIARVTR